MSVATEITRLQTLRNRLRTKLTAMGLATAAATLEDCTDAVEGITDNGAVSGTISAASDVYTVAGGYHNGSGTVQIAAAEQAKVVAGNIRSGVTLLGVEGTYSGEGTSLQSKTVTPTTSQQTVAADDGYDGLSSVTVEAIPDEYAVVSSVTATADNVLANKIFVDSTGAETAGTMTNNGAVAATIDGLTTTSYTIPEGYHSGTGTVSLTDDIETALAAI
ncbi:MAG: hypothetical protein LIP12_01735 [Clostridiales bacterium]|nr:hypothetical protein [Clostridiales bacterium]